MKIGAAIYSVLANDSDVSALVATRIYPNVATQSSAFPFIVYQTTGVDPNDTKDGVSTVDGNSFETLCFADTYTEAVDLATKTRVALDRYTGTVAGIEVQSIQYESSDEDFDIKGEGEGVYVQSLSFTLRQISPV